MVYQMTIQISNTTMKHIPLPGSKSCTKKGKSFIAVNCCHPHSALNNFSFVSQTMKLIYAN